MDRLRPERGAVRSWLCVSTSCNATCSHPCGALGESHVHIRPAFLHRSSALDSSTGLRLPLHFLSPPLTGSPQRGDAPSPDIGLRQTPHPIAAERNEGRCREGRSAALLPDGTARCDVAS